MANFFDKNAEKLTSLIISKIESISIDWEKPWFNVKNITTFRPQNINGRYYTGGNIFTLLFYCDEMGYKYPMFLTFNQAKENDLLINKGAKSFPIYYKKYCAFEKETNIKLSFDEYKKLNEEDKKKYRLVASVTYYLVFNIEQTNFASVQPQRWEKIISKFEKKEIPTNNPNMIDNYLLDNSINNGWCCPIFCKDSDNAFYNKKTDSIFLPRKTQFIDGESFYITALHEMAHSTGVEKRLNRTEFSNYPREELVAELTAALTGIFLGLSATIRHENAAYLKGWCESMREKPQFIFTVLSDAIKASKFITENIGISFEEGNEENF